MTLLKIGHMLVFETPDDGNSPSAGDVDCSLTTEVRYRLPNGTVKTATMSLMFPASSGSVSRIMDSWYAARGELPPWLRRGEDLQYITFMVTNQDSCFLLVAGAVSENRRFY